jgi:preprotein translocase subunit SecF
VSAFGRLFRGETSFDFAGRWRRWFAASGLIILIGLISLGVRGLNFSIDFRGGTVWQVPTTASVGQVRAAIGGISTDLSQATITELTDRESGKRQIKVEAPAKETANSAQVAAVTSKLAGLAHVPTNDVQLNDIGPSWGSDITTKAVEAVIVFLVLVTAYIWFRFEAKMAVAALVALVHDILITVGIYSLSGFQVSPDTVIAFLTILGYSLYDTIVVFDKVQENTKGLASTGRLTYTETVNLSMNQVLARSINTSFVAIIPIFAILVIGAGVLGASALADFGLALFIGLTTGAYSSIFIASPLLALLKEREPRYAQIRERAAHRPKAARTTPRAAATLEPAAEVAPAPAATPAATAARAGGRPPAPGKRRVGPGGSAEQVVTTSPESGDGDGAEAPEEAAGGAGTSAPRVPPRANRPPPRPRKKRRR